MPNMDPAKIKARLYSPERTEGGDLEGKEIAVRIRGNRHFITVAGEASERVAALCNRCGSEHAAGGSCCGCGAPA